jgi:hypothetical protein
MDERTRAVNSRIKGGIRRNFNRLWSFCDAHLLIDLGFVRHIFADFTVRAHAVAEVGGRVDGDRHGRTGIGRWGECV